MKQRHILRTLVIALFVLLTTGFSLFPPSNEFHLPATGEALAKQYCTNCHVFPDPNLLDRSTWKEKVLPNMGWRLGIRKGNADPFADMEEDEAVLVRELKVFPTTPLLSEENWNKIVEYYLQKAPNNPLPQDDHPIAKNNLSRFKGETIFIGEKQAPKTTLLKYDSLRSHLYIGDASNEVSVLQPDLQFASYWQVESAPVDVDFPKNGPVQVLCIGSITPSEKKKGRIMVLDSVPSTNNPANDFINLARPVQFAHGDLNGDGKEDLVLGEFGNHTGKLSWYDGSNRKKEHVLRNQPGSRKIDIVDMNRDGKPDVVAMLAQGREGIWLFENQGNGVFKDKNLIQLPPVYGVSYYELDDFNNDGFPDILMTNGDNWDISPVSKFYHGIRIYMNDGNNNFKETYFYPYYGASKAMARDFDNDGDLDIAAISFYEDYDKPEKGFVYLENKGNLSFTASTTKDAGSGKWLTMEVADINKDGQPDIIIGSYIHTMNELTKLLFKGVESFPQAVILWNNKK